MLKTLHDVARLVEDLAGHRWQDGDEMKGPEAIDELAEIIERARAIRSTDADLVEARTERDHAREAVRVAIAEREDLRARLNRLQNDNVILENDRDEMRQQRDAARRDADRARGERVHNSAEWREHLQRETNRADENGRAAGSFRVRLDQVECELETVATALRRLVDACGALKLHETNTAVALAHAAGVHVLKGKS